jgi:hypothetical protein
MISFSMKCAYWPRAISWMEMFRSSTTREDGKGTCLGAVLMMSTPAFEMWTMSQSSSMIVRFVSSANADASEAMIRAPRIGRVLARARDLHKRTHRAQLDGARRVRRLGLARVFQAEKQGEERRQATISFG